MNKNNLFIIILFVITTIYYIPIINLPLAPYDEAFILVGAEKILNGQVPHRDFSSEYPAGQISTLAVLFKVFGISVITERVYDLLIKSLLSLFIYLIIRYLSSCKYALVGWAMSLIWLQHSSFPAYPVYPSILFIFISVYLLLLYMNEKKNYYLLLSTLSIVFSIFFRHDIGGYAAIVITFFLIFRRVMGVQSWIPLISFIAIGVLAELPVIIYFYMKSALGYLYNDLILMPLSFPQYNAFPYPSLSRWNLPFYVFPFVVVTGAITSVILIKRKKDDTAAYAILLISFIGILFLNQARWRSDMGHLIPVALTGILLAPVLLHMLSSRLSLNVLPSRILFALFIIFFSITLSKPVEVIKRLMLTTNGYIVKNINPDFERVKHLNISTDMKNTVAYIKKNTSESDYIYAGVKNHDQFKINDVVIYFLSKRDSASRYILLNPGVQTTIKVQEEMVNEFKTKSPQLIVLSTRVRYEPNLSSIDTKVDLLDNYISSHYELKETYGLFEIWMKKMNYELS
jgi:hypothetical protein